jgi:hypothetical protein
MQFFSAVTLEEARELSKFKFEKGSNMKLMLPMLVIGIALVLYFGWDYYRDWRMKRRFRRYWQGKPTRSSKKAARTVSRP